MAKFIKGHKGYWLGKKRDSDTVSKVRAANLGKTAWNKGKKGIFSKETLKKMSLKKLGIPLSDETKKRMSQCVDCHKKTDTYAGKLKKTLYGD